MEKKVVAFINNGEIVPVSKVEWKTILSVFDNGSKVTVTIENYTKEKSLGQLALIHKLFSLVAKELGWEDVEMKDYIKKQYGVWVDKLDSKGRIVADKKTGEIIRAPKSLANYSAKEMSELIDKVYQLAHDNGIIMPERNQLASNNLPL